MALMTLSNGLLNSPDDSTVPEEIVTEKPGRRLEPNLGAGTHEADGCLSQLL